ncbi:hypothetical protein C8R44DRAFT_900745 [Mycena epipterygia]|nr:hypothetical protein C8R44DRAFT_900745 [Mycena epipterygia]
MKDTIEEFDRSLLLPVVALFDEGEDWSDPAWLDTAKEVYPRIGYSSESVDEHYVAGMRATVGSTALIAFLDHERKNLWVASLGDCDAVCGRRKDNKWTSFFLSERHNCNNPDEVQRLHREHPNEDHVVQDDSLLGTLRITRDGLQDVLRFPEEQKFNVVVSMANGEHDVSLGHECIPAQAGDNVAQRVIENVLFGTDAGKKS